MGFDTGLGTGLHHPSRNMFSELPTPLHQCNFSSRLYAYFLLTVEP